MKKNFCLFFIAIIAGLFLKAQEKAIYVSGGDCLPYRLLYPARYDTQKNYPLIIFLHGAGQRGRDNQKQLTALPQTLTGDTARKKYACFIVVPQCSENDMWVSFPKFPKDLHASVEPTTSTRLPLALLNKLIKELPVNKKQIYVTGYSMGGEGAFDFLTRAPIYSRRQFLHVPFPILQKLSQ
jgi:predicted peptidase